MGKYSAAQVEDMCKDYINSIDSFYNGGAINYSGKTNGIPYTEIVAGFVLDNTKLFETITPICRGKDKPYNQNHDGEYDPTSNREEELCAMDMFNQCRNMRTPDIGDAGRIVDYQVPLKNRKSDKAGKIDLLSETDDTVYILELKKNNSHESLLRCVLEGYTYLKTIENAKEKLFYEFGLDMKKRLHTAPLIFSEGYPYRDLQELLQGKRPKLKKLMKEWGIAVFVLSKEFGVYKTERIDIP